MNFWTIIFDYKGGTYIHQVSAFTISEAMHAIGAAADSESIERLLDGKFREPVKIDGMKNVWCVSRLVDDELLLVNIVLTVRSET